MSGSVVSNHMDGADCPVPVTQVGPSTGRSLQWGERVGMRKDTAGLTRTWPRQDRAQAGPPRAVWGESEWTRSWQSVDQGVEVKDDTDFLLEYLGGWQG